MSEFGECGSESPDRWNVNGEFIVAAAKVLMQLARYRERHSVSGTKSDTGDAHTLGDMVRTDCHQLRPIAGDSVEGAVMVVTRAHKR